MPAESWRDVRPVALGVAVRDGPDGPELLLAEHRDPTEESAFYRPPGGGVEFGETSEAAVRRELREELSVTVTGTERLAVLERTFEFDGQPCHEIGFVYRVTVAEDWPYERDTFEGEEPEFDETFPVQWVPVGDLERDDVTVYPEELAALVS